VPARCSRSAGALDLAVLDRTAQPTCRDITWERHSRCTSGGRGSHDGYVKAGGRATTHPQGSPQTCPIPKVGGRS
jgi:hypothetical protein